MIVMDEKKPTVTITADSITVDCEPEQIIKDLKRELAMWKGRAVEATEQSCQLCRHSDLDLCRHCRMEKIRKEAGQQ